MFERLILCATHDKLIAGRWSLGRLRSYEVFINDAQGHAAFAQYLLRNSYIPIYVMVDAQEEDFHLETLPHASGTARKEMLQRKLNQVYRGVTFRAAQFLLRERDKRKDDRFLFVALTNSEFFQPWLESIIAQQAPLAGVYNLSMTSQFLLQKLKLSAGDILLSEQLSSGLRQSYLHQGKLRVSRQVKLPTEDPEQLPFLHLVETDKARLYLLSQRLIARDTALKVVVLTSSSAAERISRDIQQEQGLECQAINLATVARQIGLPPAHVQQLPELMHMHLMARGYRPANLAPVSMIKTHRLEFVRKSLVAAALVIASLGLLFSLLYLGQAIDDAQEIQQLVADTRVQEQRYQEAANNFPPTQMPGLALETAAKVRESIHAQEHTPRRMMQILSAVLEQMPSIELQRLRWVLSTDPEFKDEAQAMGATQASGISNNAELELGFVTGEIRGFSGNYRAALESVHRLAETLKTNPEVQDVSIVQQPVNVSSYSSLQGSTTDERTAQREKAVFKLKLVLKPRQEAEALPLATAEAQP